MRVATYVDGRGIDYEESTKQFSADGAPLTMDQMVAYEREGQLAWVSNDMRSWFSQLAGGAVASAGAPAAVAPVKKKKTGLIIGIIVGVLLICGACAAFGNLGGDSDTDSDSGAVDTPAEPAAEAPAAEEPAVVEDTRPKIGEPLKVGDLVFTVQDAQTVTELTSVFGNKSGNFMVVTVNVKNESKEAVTLNTSFFKLVEGDGTVYETDSDSLMYIDAEESFFLEAINPKLEKTGKVIFAIPAGITDLELQVQTGAWGTEQGRISLTP